MTATLTVANGLPAATATLSIASGAFIGTSTVALGTLMTADYDSMESFMNSADASSAMWSIFSGVYGSAFGCEVAANGRRNERLQNQGVVSNGGSKTKYGNQLGVSDQKMYQQGDHYNKHGRDMGYASKKDYEAGARTFIESNKNSANIFEGVWNSSRGGQSSQTQIIIRSEGKQAIINKATGQIIDFYKGTSLDGFINKEVQ